MKIPDLLSNSFKFLKRVHGVGSSGATELRKGALVELQHLQAVADMNGRRGIIRRFLPQLDRWEVEIDGIGISKQVHGRALCIELYVCGPWNGGGCCISDAV